MDSFWNCNETKIRMVFMCLGAVGTVLHPTRLLPPARRIQRDSDYGMFCMIIALVKRKFLASPFNVRRSLGNLLGCVLALHSCGPIVVRRLLSTKRKYSLC